MTSKNLDGGHGEAPEIARPGDPSRAGTGSLDQPLSPDNRVNRRTRRATRRRLLAAGLALILVCTLTGGWLLGHTLPARSHLLTAANLMATLQQQLRTTNSAAVRATLAQLQRETHAARGQTNDPVWRLAGHAPWVGNNFAAVGTVAAVLDDLANRGLPELVDAMTQFSVASLLPHDGRLDLTGLSRLTPALTIANEAFRAARDRVAGIPDRRLLDEIDDALAQLRTEITQATQLTGTALRTVTLLPRMLGARGPRTYLVLFQNLAEVRATGGMPGAFAVVRVDRGTFTVTRMGSATSLRYFDKPVLPLSPESRRLYGELPGIYPADVNLSPHFPTAATLAREMYRRRSGTAVDGVIATDPVALGYLLRATGPIAMPQGAPLTAATVVRMLLSDVYSRIESTAAQDVYYTTAAERVFAMLLTGRLNPQLAISALIRAAEERRLLIWSADPAEEREITGTPVEGALPADDGDTPTVGVFLNDGSGSKLSYYLTHSARLRADACRSDGRQMLQLQITIGSTAPRTGLSPSVLGMGLAGNPYTSRNLLMIFTPTAGGITDAKLDGVRVSLGSGLERGRSVGMLKLDLKPGSQHQIDISLLTGRGQSQKPRIQVTPGVTTWSETVEWPAACQTVR